MADRKHWADKAVLRFHLLWFLVLPHRAKQHALGVREVPK